MAAPQGTIRFHQEEQALLFEVEGWATMSQSMPVRRFVEQNSSGPSTKVWVDLRQCSYIDSTFLGTLLFLQRASDRQGSEFRLVSPSEQCTTLLKQMGVWDIFHVLTSEECAATSWKVLCKEPEDKQCLQRNVIQAHEELAKLPGAAGEPFRAVVRCLHKDTEKK